MLEIKQANERYLFKLKQEEETLLYDLQQAIDYNKVSAANLANGLEGHYYSHNGFDIEYILNGTWMGKDIYCPLEEYIEFKMQADVLYFTFGKYKGRIVQDIVVQDKDYCEWFSENVCGRDLNTLKILDFLHKALIGNPYIDKDKQEVINKAMTLFPVEWIPYIKLDKKTSCAYMPAHFADDPADHWMADVLDYGDLC